MDLSAPETGRFGTAFDRLGIERAWTRTRGGQVVIGIVDRGVQADHPLLGPNIRREPAHAQFATGEHEIPGTHAAGVAAGRACGAAKFAGVAPEARILPVRIGSGASAGLLPDLAHAIEYAAEMGASIINVAHRSDLSSPAAMRAIQYAAARNVLVVCAAGATPQTPPRKDANFAPNLITVAPVGERGESPNYSPPADIAAPAFARVPQWRGSGHVTVRDDALGAPYVSGCAALVKAQNPGWGYHELKEHMLASAALLPDLEHASSGGRALSVANAVLGPLDLVSEPNLRWSSLSDAVVRWTLRYRSAYCAQVSVLYRPAGDEHWRELAAGRAGNLKLVVPAEAMRRSAGTMRLACRGSNFYSEEMALTIE
ncbi:MAG: S8 family serine peptidase [Steroidobacteraceae bacterium]|nr:S8 family serine peptidase [Steroidobacteraceae bacterium]